MIALLKRDEGMSLAMVIMALMVVSAIGIGSMQVAQHANDVTSIDRERLQAIQAAEAGANDALRRLASGYGCDLAPTSSADLHDGTEVVGRYRTRIDPEAGTTCGQTPVRVVHSWGFAPTGGTRAMRQLEVSVKLVPGAGFPYTLFAQGNTGTIFMKNVGTVNGDAFAETFDQSKNDLVAQNMITTGSLQTVNNASYSGTVWAAGDVTLANNSSVGGSVLASGTAPGTNGDVSLGSGVVVGGDVLARGSVARTNGVVVQGSLSDHNGTVPPPPSLVRPDFVWDATTYPQPPVEGLALTMSTVLSANKAALHGTYHSTDPTGVVTIPDSVTVDGDLTIVSAGKVNLGRTLSVSGGPWKVVIVSLSTAPDAIATTKSMTAASGLHVLLYTVGGVDVKNSLTMTGAIYADQVDAKNTFSLTHSDVLAHAQIPGFTFDQSSATSFTPVPTLWRELAPGPVPQ